MNGTSDPVLRPLEALDELRACVALQERVWGPGFSERVPVAILMASRRLGGVLEGAFTPESETLDGFVFGLTGPDRDAPADGGSPPLLHWSDMLAVRPEARGRGLGVLLKLHQRRLLLRRGVRRVVWTFDPLEARNAWINLERLGAVADRYHPDLYGSTGSPLHRGLGTDRLFARWDLDHPRVRERVERPAGPNGDLPADPGEHADVPLAFEVGADAGGRPRPSDPDARPHLPQGGRWRVPIPAHVQALRDEDADLAVAWRRATRAALSLALEAGWEVRGLVRGGSIAHYLVERPEGAARQR